jgi:hypothetical protein
MAQDNCPTEGQLIKLISQPMATLGRKGDGGGVVYRRFTTMPGNVP